VGKGGLTAAVADLRGLEAETDLRRTALARILVAKRLHPIELGLLGRNLLIELLDVHLRPARARAPRAYTLSRTRVYTRSTARLSP